MKQHAIYVYLILLLSALNSCDTQANKAAADTSHRNAQPTPWPPGDSLYYIALKDSARLVHVKNQFYRTRKGKLFEKMSAPKRADNPDAGVITFFRATYDDLDPLTFEVIDESWFARDKHFVYYYKPDDRGMLCARMAQANVESFKLLPGDNEGIYGADNKHLFEESDMIKNINPLNMRLIGDKEGHVVKVVSGRFVYTFGSGTQAAIPMKTGIRKSSHRKV